MPVAHAMTLLVNSPRLRDYEIENAGRLFHFANQSRNENFLTDVVIKVGNVNISAHRFVLSCHSKFFKSMFQTNMKERYQGVVEIKEFDGHLIKLLIDFMYTGKISIDHQQVMGLLAAADFLQLDDAKMLCFEFLQNEVSVDNCIAILNAAEVYDSEKTKMKSLQFIAKNFKKVSTSDDFKSLQKGDVVLCISGLEKYGAEHEVMYNAILAWTKHDFATRKSYFPELFPFVPLAQLSADFLEFNVLKEELVETNFDCYKLTMETLKLHLKGDEPNNQTKLISIGGENTGSNILTVYTEPSDTTPAFEYPDLPVTVCAHAVVVFKNILYCIGGCVNAKSSNYSCRVFTLDLSKIESEWLEIASMNHKRSDLGAAVFQNYIVAAGAYDAGSKATAELYIQEVNKWINLPSMLVCRSGHQLIACKGSLFSIGGKDEKNNYVASVEKLESLDQQWKFVASMNSPRSFFTAVECNGFIYAFGGYVSGPQDLARVEKYDPMENQWSFACNRAISRFDHKACVMQGKVYVVGGYDGSQFVKEIECYDPNNDSWVIVTDSQHQLYRFALIAI